jgi:hypothetical protein
VIAPSLVVAAAAKVVDPAGTSTDRAGFHVRFGVAFATVKVTSVNPVSNSAVKDAVARTTQFPTPVYVNAPVDASTVQVLVVLLTFE